MKVHLGVKSDPIESRYSFPWLFDLMARRGVRHLQLGSSFPLFFAADGHYRALRREAEARGIAISSLFTSHREFGGFSSGDPLVEDATRRGWERIIHVASIVGAPSAGSNAGIVLRDQPTLREPGIRRFYEAMGGILRTAKRAGLAAIAIEPMSSEWEFPSTAADLDRFAAETAALYERHGTRIAKLELCGDISHGMADADGRVLEDNWTLFEKAIPWMREFHFKNTDGIFNSTFGFGPEERKKGIVDLRRLRALIDANADRFPVKEIVGYLEIGGPKVGREYTDRHLEKMLVESLDAILEVFS